MTSFEYRKTPARTAVTEFLSKSNSPVDVLQIINFLRSKNLSTNKVTVYRIMDSLYKNGIVTRLEFQEGKFRYEIKNTNHHHHLICTKCGKIEDVEGEYIHQLEADIFKNKKFKVTGHSLEFFGLCRNCLAKQN
jgi:Fur family ferric uptake transcriptional regulator